MDDHKMPVWDDGYTTPELSLFAVNQLPVITIVKTFVMPNLRLLSDLGTIRAVRPSVPDNCLSTAAGPLAKGPGA